MGEAPPRVAMSLIRGRHERLRQKMLRLITGWLLVLVGIAGLILPIMPGWVFLIPGLVILAERFTWAKRLLAWAKEKAAMATSRR